MKTDPNATRKTSNLKSDRIGRGTSKGSETPYEVCDQLVAPALEGTVQPDEAPSTSQTTESQEREDGEYIEIQDEEEVLCIPCGRSPIRPSDAEVEEHKITHTHTHTHTLPIMVR